MSQPIQLIVGLANPGLEYANTRHNAGAWLVEAVAQRAQTMLRFEAKYHGLHSLITLNQQSCHLLIPTTFMNHSGQAVQSCMRYHKLSPSTILIVHDDIDLPPGTVKLKLEGGDGGHNGLKDIIHHLHTKAFCRLRIGVGHPRQSSGAEVADYVLAPPAKADKQKIECAIEKAEIALPFILSGEISKAMQILHTE